MGNPRTYGHPPFKVAVLHGGPGAAGEMAPVARELSRLFGVLEPLQTATSLEGQVMELKTVLERSCSLPAILVGSSWGAWLGFILAAKHPSLVKKLILVGSGPFEEEYASKIPDTRLSRLSDEEKHKARVLMEAMDDPRTDDKDISFAGLGKLLSKADSYDPLALATEKLEYRYDIYQRVWRDAERLRGSGKLLALANQIECPVVAIHGDYDPHPSEGVQRPLSRVLKDFTFFLLENCGHHPWMERNAKVSFYAILRRELA